jgi:hypothetical protein
MCSGADRVRSVFWPANIARIDEARASGYRIDTVSSHVVWFSTDGLTSGTSGVYRSPAAAQAGRPGSLLVHRHGPKTQSEVNMPIGNRRATLAGRCIAAVVSALLLTVLTGIGTAFAGEPSKSGEANHGLPPGVSQPAWARHRGIQFLPSPSTNARSSKTSAISSDALTPEFEESNGEKCLEGHHWCGPGEPPLVYKGGEVEQNPAVHVIFWGKWGSGHGRTTIEHFFSGVSGSKYQSVLTQYDDHTGPVSGTVKTAEYYVDTSSATEVTAAKILSEAEKAIKAKKWATGPNDLFLVLVSGTFASGFSGAEGSGGFCGYHQVLKKSEVVKEESAVAFVPYQGDEPFEKEGCGGSLEEQPYATEKVTTAEYVNSVTDPYSEVSPGPSGTGHAWIESGEGSEIADFCERHSEYSGDEDTAPLWDNHLEQCTREDESPPAAVIPPGATTQAASVTCTSGTLNGTVEPSEAESEYYFEYRESGGTLKKISASSGKVAASWATDPVSYDITGLTPGTKYDYVLVAQNANGTTKGFEKEFETTCEDKSEFGSQGSGNGEFEEPWGVAVDGSGNIWVVDRGNRRLEEFSSTGTFTAAYPLGEHMEKYPLAIAINRSTGDVYVDGFPGPWIEEFSSTGKPIRAFKVEVPGVEESKVELRGLALNSEGKLLVIAENNVDELSAEGHQESSFTLPADSEERAGEWMGITETLGHIYVSSWSTGRALETTTSGEVVREFGESWLSDNMGIASNPTTGEIYVSHTHTIDEYGPEGNLMGSLGTEGRGPSEFIAITGLAVTLSGDVLATDSYFNRVEEWAPST